MPLRRHRLGRSAGHAGRPVRLAAIAVAAVLVASGCGALGPSPLASGGLPETPRPSVTRPPDAIPVPSGAGASSVLLTNATGTYDAYRGVARLDGSSACTATLLATLSGPAATNAPAFVLTAGHCARAWGSNEIQVDAPAESFTVTFDYFVDTQDAQVKLPVKSVSYATMKGVDLALLEIDATLGDLTQRGITPLPLRAADPPEGLDVVNIGAPVSGNEADQAFLRAGSCRLGPTALVRERQWLWWTTLRTDCPGISGGSSGSPVIDRATGEIAGIITTTTLGGESGTACALGRPCEVGPDGTEVRAGTSYAMLVSGLEACFGPDGRFSLEGACPLDPGLQFSVTGAPTIINPGVPRPDGRDAITTWNAALKSEELTHYRYKTGPLAATDCREDIDYGDPVDVAKRPRITDPLPMDAGQYVLCVIGGASAEVDDSWQVTAYATVLPLEIDTTPPTKDPVVNVRGDRRSGWTIELVFDPPELSWYNIKYGPARTTSCEKSGGYRAYSRVPVKVPARSAPARICVLAYDDANNPAPVWQTTLK